MPRVQINIIYRIIIMKKNIHPKYYPQATVTCVCGNTFKTGSILENIQVDICSQCHPFYTGEMRFVDTQGRVEKFQKKMQIGSGKYISKKQRRQAKASINDKKQNLSLGEMMKQAKSQKSNDPSEGNK